MTSPLFLAIDTAGSACSVALGRGEAVLAQARREMRHGHGEALLPMIDAVTRDAGAKPCDIHAVAVSVGPGGFTGIRVGLAAARGIALAAGARLIGVTGFAAVAAVAPRNECSGALLVALDSRRDELYVQLFDAAAVPLAEPAAVLPGDLPDYLAALAAPPAITIAGDAAEAAAAALQELVRTVVLPGSSPDACGVLAAATRQLQAGGPPLAAHPLYLRPPDVSFPKVRPEGALPRP